MSCTATSPGVEGTTTSLAPSVGLAIVHVVLSLDAGGLERVVLDLARLATSRGHRATILCLGHPGTLAAAAEAGGTGVIALDRPPGLRSTPVDPIVDVLDELRPDVIHTHQIGALFHAGAAARGAGVPAVVHTEHGDHVARCTTPTAKLRALALRAIAATRADRFCCVSAELADRVGRSRTVPRRKLVVVSNGIDLPRPERARPEQVADARRELGVPPDVPIVGTLGRLAEVKRQDVLVHGFARLAARAPEARLVVIGDGPERGPLEALAATLGVGDRVIFAGYRDEPARLLPALDVFALTSRSEGMPLAILEAWAASLPVVATRVGGVAALVEPDVDGLLIEPGDAAGVASMLGRLVADPALARRLGSAGRAKVARSHERGAMGDNYDRIYRAVLAGPAARRRRVR